MRPWRSFDEALKINPDYAPAHLGLALAFRQQRRPEDAEASCAAALAADPGNVEAVALLGELMADRGRFAEAEAQFQRAIELKPDYAPAYSSMATHRRMTLEDEPWLKGALSLAGRRLPLTQAIGLHYALGKYYDDTKQYEPAFEHFTQANQSSKRFASPYDRGQLTHTRGPDHSKFRCAVHEPGGSLFKPERTAGVHPGHAALGHLTG